MRSILICAALALTSCSPGGSTVRATILERQMATDPPALWLAEALDDAGRVHGAVRVCADTPLREGLMRPIPAVGNVFCVPERHKLELSAGHTHRCELNGRRYSVHVGVTGDPQQEFQVNFTMARLGDSGPAITQLRRYRRVGACPAGWKIGDSDRPGGARLPNALS